MAILVDKETRVLVQGITGQIGSFQTKIMKEAGTKVVAGVTPGKGGEEVHGVPVYDFIEEALEEHSFDAIINFVPARFAKDAAFEAIESEVPFLVITAEGFPAQDIMRVIAYAVNKGVHILGPDTPGVVSPGKCKLGVHPERMLVEGRVGVLSRSGALSYEACKALSEGGYGQSTVVGIGGGPLWGLREKEVLKMFDADPETKVIVLLGEVGGTMEQEAAEIISNEITTPVVALIVGKAAPRGAQMGHAGAIVEGKEGTAEYKVNLLREAGAYVAESPDGILKVIDQMEVI
ncbi:succinate--CoA ligase subunit alpha [Candidatus Bipolaricaulota bacterium]|nr:succinate--CoA ligase subunit alpha [Candidatus Bipolaricaulota bacterium]MBS3792100.1 succinate--CoA ligase subunit alpha [Candidatus Bipolaricaulota bacterium]